MYSDYIKRKEQIVIMAIDLLDEVGIQRMTTKEIAKRQGITEPAIYRHFSGKKDIILSILDRFSDFDTALFNTVTEQQMRCIDAIRYLVNTYAGYYEGYPQITTVMLSYDMFRYDEDTNKKMQSIILNRRNFLIEVIKKGQNAKEFSSKISCENAAEIVIGAIWSTTYSWKLFDYKFSLKQKASEMLEAFLENWIC